MKRNVLHWFATFLLLLAMLTLHTTARATPQDKPELPKIIRKSGGVLQGSATKRVEPAYPPLAKTARVSGAVVVEVTVDEDGKVISARAVSGHPLLKDAAVNAARAWMFTPTTLQGTPVKVIGTITIYFDLDPKEEIEKLQQQIAEKPNDPQLYHNLGFTYISARELDKAIESFRQALALKPDYADAWIGIGKAYEGMERIDEAIDAYKQVIQLNPDSELTFTAFRFLGTLYFNHQRYPEAVEAIKQAIAKRPDVDSMYMLLAGTYLRMGDKDSAMAQYRILKERHSDRAEELLKQINSQQ
ncbi:MAG: periplasmic protein TonB [Blastocatellia bacterium]